MVELVEEAQDTGTRLKLVLENLRHVDTGPAQIANLCRALETNHIDASQLRNVISRLKDTPSDTVNAYRLLLDHICAYGHNLYFRRQGPLDWDEPVALVLDTVLLDRGAHFRLFSSKYITESTSTGAVPVDAKNVDELADMLTYIRAGFAHGLGDTGLGERFDAGRSLNGRVVFVTPVNEFWEKLTAGRFRGPGDPYPAQDAAHQVCDYLGLPHRNGWLIELRSRLTLSQLVQRGRLAMAAPTVLEAWSHKFFRHWPRDATHDAWGKTLYLRKGLVGAAEPPGLPEAILDHLPPSLLSSEFEVSIIGKLIGRSIPDQHEVNEFLVAKRDLADLIDDIVSKVTAS